jgi:hypothetical protein
MDSLLAYVPLISLIIVAGLFVVAIVNFSIVRKNMQKQNEQWIKNLKIQSEQQIYSRIMDVNLKLENRINKRNMIDTDIWFRWRGLAKTVMTIPKFKRVLDKTSHIHSVEFRNFMNSL